MNKELSLLAQEISDWRKTRILEIEFTDAAFLAAFVTEFQNHGRRV